MGNSIDDIFKNLDFLFRYFASGFVWVFVEIQVNGPCLFNGIIEDTRIPASAVYFIAAMLIGMFLYALHTNVIVRVIFWPLILRSQESLSGEFSAGQRIAGSLRKIREIMLKLDERRWERRYSVCTKSDCAKSDHAISALTRNKQHECDKWASQVKFLFCSSYSFILIPVVTPIVHILYAQPVSDFPACVFLFGLFLLECALYSDYKLTERELLYSEID